MRTFMTFVVLIFCYAGLYVAVGGPTEETNNFLEASYFSVVTFTTLGYGDISPTGWSRLLACTEALVGVFMNSLFIFVFCRKMIQ